MVTLNNDVCCALTTVKGAIIEAAKAKIRKTVKTFVLMPIFLPGLSF
jgi:hypothetical protein